jgi:flagellar hook assembly protein FlgD
VTTPLSGIGGVDAFGAKSAAAATAAAAAPKDATASKLGSDAFLQLLVAQL